MVLFCFPHVGPDRSEAWQGAKPGHLPVCLLFWICSVCVHSRACHRCLLTTTAVPYHHQPRCRLPHPLTKRTLPHLPQGFLFPRFNSFYWIGLRTQSWPNFIFIDTLDGGSYMNWGTMQDPLLDEPNNLGGSEFCAGANYTQLTSGSWGWSDELCTTKAAFVCKIRREALLPACWCLVCTPTAAWCMVEAGLQLCGWACRIWSLSCWPCAWTLALEAVCDARCMCTQAEHNVLLADTRGMPCPLQLPVTPSLWPRQAQALCSTQ